MALTEKLTAIADAIRRKTGKTEGLTLEQMESEISGIQTGGDTSAEDGLVARTLSTYTNDRVTEIGAMAFEGFNSLTEVSFPNVIEIKGAYNFASCTNLAKIDFPKLEIGSNASNFRGCKSIQKVTLPRLLRGGVSFWDCSTLEFYDGGRNVQASEIRSIGLNDFDSCAVLKTVILRYPVVVPLSRMNYIQNTPFATDGTGGTVYVPQALIEQYQTATNWSTLYAAGTCNFAAIEGSEYE
jgi:hypothetical protein